MPINVHLTLEQGDVFARVEAGRGRSGTPREAALPPTVGKILSRIAKFADIRADRGSLQVERFGYLSFGAPLPPKPHKQLTAFDFGRSLPRQEFRRRERANMPVRHPSEQLDDARHIVDRACRAVTVQWVGT
jgi:hypothetical protein